MRYWAINLYSIIQKTVAIVAAVSAFAAFVVVLFTLSAVEQALAQRGIRFVEGALGVGIYAFCGFGAALIAAIGIYAFAQVLELLISLDENLRGLRSDLRELRPETPQARAERIGRGLTPVAPSTNPTGNYAAPAGRPDTDRRAAAQTGRDAQLRRIQAENDRNRR